MVYDVADLEIWLLQHPGQGDYEFL